MTGSLQKLATIAAQSWRDRAACAWADPRLFDGPNRTEDATRIRAALAICRACPVRDDCLEDGITNRESGVRGGRLLDYGVPRPLNPTVERATVTRLDAGLDEIAVERIMHGTLTVPLREQSPELREAIRRLAALGLRDDQIGERVGRRTNSVQKLRERAGTPSAVERFSHRRRKAG